MTLRKYLWLLLVGSSFSGVQGQVAATKTQQSPTASLPMGTTVNSPQATAQMSDAKTNGMTTDDFRTSVETLRSQRAQARASGLQSKEAEAALNEARTLELWSTVDPSKADQLPQAVAAYQAVISSGSASQRSVASNNLAVLLLKQGKPADALQTFQNIDFNSIATADSYLYQYNFGRALELNKDPAHAYSKYSQAARLRPDFTPAVEAAFRVIGEVKPPPVEDAAGLATLVMRKGSAQLVHAQLKQLLLKWNKEEGASRLLSALVQCYVVLALRPLDFQNAEWPWLKEIGSPSLKPGIDGLRIAFSGQFSYNFGYAAEVFQYWSRGTDQEAFGDLLKLIGDHFADSALYSQALTCYANSWLISRKPEAALYAASVLRDAPQLDPGGRLTDQLVISLFEQKGGAYAKDDWPNILRLHTVLGTIFEGEARWGSASDPRSAIFQWEHALVAQSRVQKGSSDYPPAPGLNMHLANCYLRVNRPADAQSQYLEAAEAYVKAGERDEALAAIRRLRSIGDPNMMTRDKSNRLRTLEDSLAHFQT